MNYIKSPRMIERFGDTTLRCHADEMKALLGLGYKAKLPEGGMEPRVIQGFKVWVTPAAPKKIVDKWGRKVVLKVSTHRVMAECPHCKKVLSAGRLPQHVCKESGHGAA